MFMYLLGLLPLTHLIVTLRPTMNTTETGEHEITMVPVSFTEVLKMTGFHIKWDIKEQNVSPLMTLYLCIGICEFHVIS